MHVGYLIGARRGKDDTTPLADVYRAYVDDSVHAEHLGFSGIWASESHAPTGMPSVLQMLATVAARTERVRLITSVLSLPLFSPLRIAEEAAVLDHLSNGRFELGVGVGGEYDAFTMGDEPWDSRSARLREGLSFIRRAWRESGFTHEGEHYTYRNVDIVRPAQADVPIWVGTHSSGNARWAAREGYHLLSNLPVFDATVAAAGRPASQQHVAASSTLFVAPTRAEAWDRAQDAIHATCLYYAAMGWPAGADANGTLDELPAADELRDVDGFRIFPGDAFATLVGSVDEVGQVLGEVRDGRHGRVTHLPVQFRLPGIATPDVRQSMDLFATEILPTLA